MSLNSQVVRLNAEGYDDAILIDSVQPDLLVFLSDVGNATREEIEAIHPFAFNKGGSIECFVQLKYVRHVGAGPLTWILTESGKEFTKTLMELRAIELMATPVVKERYPTGKIIGWYDNYEQRYNSGDIEVGYTIGELKNTCQGMSI